MRDDSSCCSDQTDERIGPLLCGECYAFVREGKGCAEHPAALVVTLPWLLSFFNRRLLDLEGLGT